MIEFDLEPKLRLFEREDVWLGNLDGSQLDDEVGEFSFDILERGMDDRCLDEMTTEEQKRFLVHVYVDTDYTEENQKDEILFLRNDSTYVGSAPAVGGEIYIPLGDYKLVSLLSENDKIFGSLKVLESGKTVKLHVDTNQKTSEYNIID